MGDDLAAALDAFLARHETELIEFRRDLHAHPEPAYAERRTTRLVADRLTRAGLRPVLLPQTTGLYADIGEGEPRSRCAPTWTRCRWTTRRPCRTGPRPPGCAMPAGTTRTRPCWSAPGSSWPARRRRGLLPGGVRLIFQPAEETASGARDVIAAGGLDTVGRIFALHCDPRLDAGMVGIRAGAITAACDKVKVTLAGPGGHTARPHLTADVVYALGKIVTEVPAALTRRVDPRAGLSLVWGYVSAGAAANAIPDEGVVEGTVRCLDTEAWRSAVALIEDLVQSVAQAYGVTAKVEHLTAVPPTVNEPASAAMLAGAAAAVLGKDAVQDTPQSLGGEDFAWYLHQVPGAMARLGSRTPGALVAGDLHQPTFDIDERAIGAGVRVLAAVASGETAATAGE